MYEIPGNLVGFPDFFALTSTQCGGNIKTQYDYTMCRARYSFSFLSERRFHVMSSKTYMVEGMKIQIDVDKNENFEKRMISYYIRAIRNEAGMSRTEFSKWLGMPQRTLEAWERGEREMPEYVLRLIAYKVRMEKAAGRI